MRDPETLMLRRRRPYLGSLGILSKLKIVNINLTKLIR